MPLYEFACQTCNEQFEILVRGSEPPICPHCGSDALQQQLSVVSAHVAGGRGSLPICPPSERAPSLGGGCGLPQCGGGRCGMGG